MKPIPLEAFFPISSEKNLFFTSDTHFNHGNIIKYCNRPFSSVEEMNEALIKNHNAVVGKNDFVIHLGDIAFGKDIHQTVALLSQLNGRKIFLLGNHDDSLLYGSIREKGLDFLTFSRFQLAPISIFGQHVVLCHFPMLSWERSYHGSIHLHGHSHGNIPDDPLVRRVDVGVDCNNYTPVSWGDIKKKMLARPVPKELALTRAAGSDSTPLTTLV